MHALLATFSFVHALPIHAMFTVISHIVLHPMDVFPPIWD
jgi:hypothetical protein